MTLAAGIDLGLDGAIAIVDAETRQVTHLWDMPTFTKKKGRGMRRVMDAPRLHTYIQALANMGVLLITVEEPGWRQGQAGAGTVGWGAGLTVAFCIAADPPVRYEMAAPSVWKASLRLTGPKLASVRRAQEVFPSQAAWFTGPNGGSLDGRAEAALICEYGINRHLGIRR